MNESKPYMAPQGYVDPTSKYYIDRVWEEYHKLKEELADTKSKLAQTEKYMMNKEELKHHWLTRLRTETGITEWWKQDKIVEELVEELYFERTRCCAEKPTMSEKTPEYYINTVVDTAIAYTQSEISTIRELLHHQMKEAITVWESDRTLIKKAV